MAADEMRVQLESGPLAARKKATVAAVRIWRGLPLDEQGEFVRLLHGLWNVPFYNGKLSRARRVAETLRRKGVVEGRVALQAEGLLALGICDLGEGSLSSAIARLELSKALFSSTGKNQVDEVRASFPLGSAYRLQGDHKSARALLSRARTVCLAIEEPSLLASVSLNLGSTFLESGDLESALSCYHFTAHSSPLMDSPMRALRGKLGMAIANVRIGNLAQASDLADEAIALARKLASPREEGQGHEYRSCSYILTDQPLEVLRSSARAFRCARRVSIHSDAPIELHRWLAEFWIERDHPRYAALHARRARKHAETASEAEDTLALDRVDAEIEWLNGDAESALEKLIAHAARASRLGYGYEHLLTARRITTVADTLDRPEIADEWWIRTEYLAEAGGARPLFERWREEREKRGYLAAPTELPTPMEMCSPGSGTSNLADELPRVDLRRFGIITASRRLENEASLIAKLAPTKVPVLIHGQSGTGKELFARLVHELSPRVSQSFLAINCGALPAEILESELFGHRRGAFTGAIYDKPGLFREAHQGTLFLDEIGEMSSSAQAKLLRVLETGELRPVGGTRHEIVDVRIVAATNVDLAQAVEAGRFRKDLYFRLRGLEVTLPPLRQRLGDVPPLAQHFVEQANRSQGKALELTFETTQWLMGQSWPGNVRELKLAVERAVALAGNQGFLYPRHFLGVGPGDDIGSLPAELEEIERARVRNALEAAAWSTTAAARILGMSRTTLAGRIKKLGVEKPRSR